jgi:hypothetical protein
MPFKKELKPAESMPLGTEVLDLPKAPTVKTCRQELGMARTREEECEAQLEHAQREFATLSKESVRNDRLDLLAVAGVMRAAQEKMDDSERVLALARQRRAEKELALEIADWESRQQKCCRVVAQVTEVLQRWHTMQAEAARCLRDDAVPLLDEIRGFGFDLLNLKLHNFNLAFKPKLLGLYDFMPGCQTTEAWFLRDEPVSALAPTVEDVERLTRP